MIEEDFIEEQWESWSTGLSCFPTYESEAGALGAHPFQVYAGSFSDAKTTVLIHLALVLRDEGITPSWIEEKE